MTAGLWDQILLDLEPHRAALRPALDLDDLAGLHLNYGVKFEPRFRELLAFTGGIAHGDLSLDFSGKSCTFGFEDINGIPMVGDGYGNFWVTMLEDDGTLGEVAFFCHDPPVIVIEYDNLAALVRAFLENPKRFVRRFCAQITEAEYLEPAFDPALRSFLETLPAAARIYKIDESRRTIPWAEFGIDATLRRAKGGVYWAILP